MGTQYVIKTMKVESVNDAGKNILPMAIFEITQFMLEIEGRTKGRVYQPTNLYYWQNWIQGYMELWNKDHHNLMNVDVKMYNVLRRNKYFHLMGAKVTHTGSRSLGRLDKDKLLKYSRVKFGEDTENNWNKKIKVTKHASVWL